LHKPSGRAVVTLNGKDCYLGVYGSTASKREYDRLIAEFLSNGRQLNPGTDYTIAELARDFLRHAQDYYVKDGVPTSECAYIARAVRPLLDRYGATRACDFKPSGLETIRDRIVATGVCRGTVNGRIYRIVRMFKWGVGKERVPVGVYQSLRCVPGLKRGRSEAPDHPRVRPVADHDVDAIQTFVSRQVWAMIELQRLTGMRPGEVCQMRTRDIDRSGKTWTYVPGSHKTEHHGRTRVIPIGPRARAILQEWLRADPDGYLFQPVEAMAASREQRRLDSSTDEPPRDRRKCRPRKLPGLVCSVNSFRHAIARGCGLAGVPSWGPNRLRHSAGTLLRSQFGLDVARAVLGHSSPAITLVYAEADLEKAARAIEQVG
jgi:integrase